MKMCEGEARVLSADAGPGGADVGQGSEVGAEWREYDRWPGRLQLESRI